MKFRIGLWFIAFVCSLFFSCASETREEKNFEKSIYTNESVDIRDKTPGLPLKFRKVYLTLFTDFVSNTYLQSEFDRRLRHQISQMGLSTVQKIPQADVVVSGSLNSLMETKADRATNIPGLIYSFYLEYTLYRTDRTVLQNSQSIREDILVLDTNAFLSNDVVDMMLDDAVRHTSEGIVYGWQLDYSKTPDKIKTLGAKFDSNNSTNWTK